MTTHEDIVQALKKLVDTDPFFGTAEVDVAEPEDYRAAGDGLAEGLSDAVAVQDDPEPEITRDGGAEDDFELRGEFIIAYAVQAAPANRAAQRARREAAAAKITALIASDHTLGLDVQVYAQIGPAQRRANSPLPGANPVATILVPIFVDYTAPSAAG